MLRPEIRAFVDRVFAQTDETPVEYSPNTELRLKGTTTVSDIHGSYGLKLSVDESHRLADLFSSSANQPSVGDSIQLGDVTLSVREIIGNRIATVGLTLTTSPSE